MNPRLCALSLAVCLCASCGDPCDGREVILEIGASAEYGAHTAPEEFLVGRLRDNGPRFAVLDWWFEFGLETAGGTIPVGIGAVNGSAEQVARDTRRARAFAGREVALRGKFSTVMSAPRSFMVASVRCPAERRADAAVPPDPL